MSSLHSLSYCKYKICTVVTKTFSKICYCTCLQTKCYSCSGNENDDNEVPDISPSSKLAYYNKKSIFKGTAYYIHTFKQIHIQFHF